MEPCTAVFPRIPSSRPDERSLALPEITAIRIWSPSPDQIKGRLRDEIAVCLAAAFSSREWTKTPMPVGEDTDPHSARGILAGLASDVHVLVAAPYGSENGDTEKSRVYGTVLGAVLRESLIDCYGLREFGACAGDSLLAYIGLAPERHGTRLYAITDNIFQCAAHNAPQRRSFADVMFSKWLELPAIRSSPFTFIRTRLVISSIRHLADKHRFTYCGSFNLSFRGQQQERLVLKRRNGVIGT